VYISRLSAILNLVANENIEPGFWMTKLEAMLSFTIRHQYHFKCACLLSQIHLSFFAGAVQKDRLYFYAVCQNKSVGSYFDQTASS
jgi:hypothetical protein